VEFKVNKEVSRVFNILNIMTPNGFQIEILGKGNIIIKLPEPVKDRKKCYILEILIKKNIIKYLVVRKRFYNFGKVF
jgi:hypothetical protein